MKQRKTVNILILVLLGIFAFIFILKNYTLKIDSNVQNALNIMDMGDCYIIECNGYEQLPKKIIFPQVSEKDIDEYIEYLLEEQAYREKIYDRNIVQFGDLAVANYKIMYDGKQLKSAENEPIKVGSGYYDVQLETALVGLKINQEYTIDWVMPDNTDNMDLIGETLDIQIIITDIYKVVVPTIDEYAAENGFSNAKDLKLAVENKLFAINKEDLENSSTEDFINIIIDNSKFRLNENVVVDNAVSYYYQHNSMSKIYNMNFEEYLRNVLEYKGDIYNLCYEQSEHEIKRYLVIGFLAEKLNITITSDDINNFCQINNIDFNIVTDEQACFIKYDIIEEKVFDYLINKYIEIGNE